MNRKLSSWGEYELVINGQKSQERIRETQDFPEYSLGHMGALGLQGANEMEKF